MRCALFEQSGHAAEAAFERERVRTEVLRALPPWMAAASSRDGFTASRRTLCARTPEPRRQSNQSLSRSRGVGKVQAFAVDETVWI